MFLKTMFYPSGNFNICNNKCLCQITDYEIIQREGKSRTTQQDPLGEIELNELMLMDCYLHTSLALG